MHQLFIFCFDRTSSALKAIFTFRSPLSCHKIDVIYIAVNSEGHDLPKHHISADSEQISCKL